MLEAARTTRDRWLAMPGRTVRLNHEMMRTTFAIILSTMLSGSGAVDADAFERDMSATLRPVSWLLAVALLGLPEATPFPGRSRAQKAGSRLRDATRRLVEARRRSPSSQPDLLTLLEAAVDPQSGWGLSDEELVDNLLTFIAAGHETTALGLAWTLHLLAAHPEVERRAVEEIEAATDGAEVAPEHLEGMPYIRQVFSEAMRLFPPAPMIVRGARKATHLAGIPVRAGQAVVIPIYALHRHRKLWSEPDRFDPDRFAPEAEAARHRFAFLPFGGGPRVCIGSAFAMLEATAVLAILLREVQLTRDPAAVKPEAVMRVTLRALPEIEMRVQPKV